VRGLPYTCALLDLFACRGSLVPGRTLPLCAGSCLCSEKQRIIEMSPVDSLAVTCRCCDHLRGPGSVGALPGHGDLF